MTILFKTTLMIVFLIHMNSLCQGAEAVKLKPTSETIKTAIAESITKNHSCSSINIDGVMSEEHFESLPENLKGEILTHFLRIFQQGEMKSVERFEYKDEKYECRVDFSDIKTKHPELIPSASTHHQVVSHDNLPADLLDIRNGLHEDVCQEETNNHVKRKVKLPTLPIEKQIEILKWIRETLIKSKTIPSELEKQFLDRNGQTQLLCSLRYDVFSALKKRILLGPLQEPYELQAKEKTLMGDSSTQLGNLVFMPNVLTNLLNDSIKLRDSVLEIGAARGIETYKMLMKGANVTAVDLSSDDLNKLITSLPTELKDKVKTIVARFPEELHIDIQKPEDKFDIVYMSHVAHYLNGKEFRDGIKKIADLTKPGGMFYFQALTPYSTPYIWNMLHSDRLLASNTEWPGFFDEKDKETEARKRPGAVEMYHDKMPNFGHPIHPSIMKRELENSGFKVSYVGYSTFDSQFAEKLSPLTYEETEKYVKRLVEPMDIKLEQSIDAKLNKAQTQQIPHLDWKKFLDTDAAQYKWNHDNQDKKAITLKSMQVVIAIAEKR